MLKLNSKHVEPFVRNQLGCGCPAAVFEQIEEGRPRVEEVTYQRLLIGDRLLIYLFDLNSGDTLMERLSALIALGLEERDRRGYNRWRLVLVGSMDSRSRMLAETFFQEAVAGDPKAHLHFQSADAEFFESA